MKNYTLEEINRQFRNNPKLLYSSEGIHGDQFEIFKLDDGSFAVYIWNDGYPNPMAGGGCAHLIPDSLVKKFSSDRFVSWLNLNKSFYFRPLLTDEEVIEFFKQK